MSLFLHQKKFLDENPNKSALVWSCGLGKTRTAIEWAKEGQGNIGYVNGDTINIGTLVICPKHLKANWQREIGPDKALFNVITKEEFRKTVLTLGKYPQIIVDEVHIGFLTPLWKSQMSKALRKYIDFHKIPRVLLLSATVYTSSPWNIYNLAYLIGHKMNWRKFRLDFFNDVRMGPRIVPVPKKGCEKKLSEIVKKIASVVDIHEVMDVPLQLHSEPEYFALSAEQRAHMNENYDPLPIVRYTKQHEIENGVLIDQTNLLMLKFHTDKIDRIKSLVAENKKVAIVCRYNLQINAIFEALSEYKPLVIRGDVKNRHEITQMAEAAENAVVIIQGDCGVGFELPSFELCIFASMSYSYVSYEQMLGRFLRMNKPSRTTFVYLISEGESIDQAVYDSVMKKQDFSLELFARGK